MQNVGFSSMLKEGAKYHSGLEEAVIRNIEACKALSTITRTSLGPNGMNKMVENSHEKLFVTNDAGLMIKEMDVVHPAAKMVVMASEMQESEIGDATNLVVVLTGELLQQAESLIRTGLHISEIINGFNKAGVKALEFLEDLAVHRIEDPRNPAQVDQVLRSVVSSKQHGYEDFLSPLISQACIQVLPKNANNFNVDNVRVVKILGASVLDSKLVKGFVVDKGVEGTISHVKNAKIAVLATGLETAKPETKGTVLLETAEQLKEFSKGEEKQMEEIVKSIAAAGVNVVISGGAVSVLAMHFLERYKIMVIKVPSKFNLRRVCRAVGASPLVRVGAPTPEEIGHCHEINQEEIGSTAVTVIKQTEDDSGVSTIVLRGSTQNILDDVERTIDDAVNVYKGLLKDPRFVPGAGASEIEIAKRLQQVAESTPGVSQYAIRRYGEAFEVVPRILSENAGLDSTSTLSELYAAHAAGQTTFGVPAQEAKVADAVAAGVFDLLAAKYSAIKLATNCACTVLKVDQIIMAKPAGGPKARQPRSADADEPDV